MFESRIANVIAYGGTAAVLVLAGMAALAELPAEPVEPMAVESTPIASPSVPAGATGETIAKPPAVLVPAPRPPVATPTVAAPARPAPSRPPVVRPTASEQEPVVRGEAPRSLGTIAVPWPGTIDDGNSGVSGATRDSDTGRFVPPADIGR